MNYPAQPPYRPPLQEVVEGAWVHIGAAIDGTGTPPENSIRLAQGCQILEDMARPTPVDADPAFLLGKLTLDHRPVYAALAVGRRINRDDLDAVQRNLADDVLVPHRGDPPYQELKAGTANRIHRGVTSVLISRRRDRDYEDRVINAVLPTAPAAAGSDFRDAEGRGHRHLRIINLHGDEEVPVRVLETTKGARQVDLHKESEGVLHVGLGQLLLGLARASDVLRGRYAGIQDASAARRAVVADVAGMLTREARHLNLPVEEFALLNQASRALTKQIASYRKAHPQAGRH